MGSFGFCYVADSDAYIDEAMRSIESLKTHMPAAAVAFVTHPHLFRTSTDVTDWVELQQHRQGPIVKADARLAPYDRIVFLDTDTLIMSDLSAVFDLLEKFDFAFAPEPNARPDYGTSRGVPMAFPEPNSGFLAFRKTLDTLRFFDEWIAEYDALHASAGVSNDQPALRTALWRSQTVRHLMLGSEFNLIPHTNPGVAGRVAVLHDRSLDRERLASRVNRFTSPRAVIAGFGPVFGFISRRAWVTQFMRLAWEFLRVLVRPGLIEQRGYPRIWWRDGVD